MCNKTRGRQFDELRNLVYHEKHLQFDIERFPPTSDSITQHILRAYLQCNKWLRAPYIQNIALDPLDYGYRLDENDDIVPVILTKPSIPSNFPHPCTCQKCSKPNVYKCRLLGIACCQCCKYNASTECRNPVK